MKLLIISDIHANWPALRAVLKAESDSDQTLCLGDLVGYGPHPAECVAWAKEMISEAWVIQGDHDRAVTWGGNPHCWSAEDLPLVLATQAFTRKVLAPELREFLANLSPRTFFELAGARCAAYHSSPRYPISGHLGPDTPSAIWQAEVAFAHRPDWLFLGHTHLPLLRRIGGTWVVNPGSVGRPRSANARAAYALWKDGEITLRSVEYDAEETTRAYQGLELKEATVRALCAGLRPGPGTPCHQPELSTSA
jgi:predicted phosphodiesterase